MRRCLTVAALVAALSAGAAGWAALLDEETGRAGTEITGRDEPARAPSPGAFGSDTQIPQLQAGKLDSENPAPAAEPVIREVPEPTSLVIVGVSLTLLGIVSLRRRRR
tara:strand:+ start:406 stop:729 length:324 start_codon:yes stop_codon:yes gene_type:complete